MKALIIGVSGQDGAFLSQLILSKGGEVIGTSRCIKSENHLSNLESLKIKSKVKILEMDPSDYQSVLDTIMMYKPDEIYNLSGQSSVGLSFEKSLETYNSIILPTLNILEIIKNKKLRTRFYNASSAECYGVQTSSIVESSSFNPQSPYAVAKVSSHLMVKNYREVYGLYACNGTLFNHESHLRSEKYVTLKIIRTAQRIAAGSDEKLYLGNINIARDWGWAPEYVEAMWKILQQKEAEDYVIATGETNTLREFIDYTFSCLGLSSNEHIVLDESLLRAQDIPENFGNPSKASLNLDWKAKYKMRDVINKLITESE